jgi:hypothetical protein
MSARPSCLENIIGLSETTCECFEGAPAGAATSQSNLMLDQLEGLSLNLIESASDCEEGSIWDMMIKSRANAIINFKSDIMAALLSKYKHRRLPFSGIIGQQSFKSSLTITQGYAGVQIFSSIIVGGTITIRRIGLAFDSIATFPIYIYDRLTDDVVATYDVTTAANRVTWYTLDSPLVLQMNDTESSNPRYYLIYPTGAYKPKDNIASCGCSGYRPVWNPSSPQYMPAHSYNKDRWAEFIMVTGIVGDAISDRENWATNGYLNGLLVDADFKCSLTDIICTQNMDFETNELAYLIAYTIRFKAGDILVDKILSTGQINRFTMLDRESLYGKRNYYRAEYTKRIQYLVDQLNIRVNDCLMCNDFEDIVKTGILS